MASSQPSCLPDLAVHAHILWMSLLEDSMGTQELLRVGGSSRAPRALGKKVPSIYMDTLSCCCVLYGLTPGWPVPLSFFLSFPQLSLCLKTHSCSEPSLSRAHAAGFHPEASSSSSPSLLAQADVKSFSLCLFQAEGSGCSPMGYRGGNLRPEA